jgi:membrane protein
MIARPVLGALTQFSSKASRLGSVGLVALVGSVLALMLTIDRTLNAIWRVRTPRPMAQRVLIYWAAVTLGPLLLGISLSLTSYAISASQGFVGALPGGVGLLFGIVEFLALVVGMAGSSITCRTPMCNGATRSPAGCSSASASSSRKRLMAWYLVQMPSYAMVYGAFATLPIFLIWIYVSWVIVLLGAVVAAYSPSLQMRVVRWPAGRGRTSSSRSRCCASSTACAGRTARASATPSCRMRCAPTRCRPNRSSSRWSRSTGSPASTRKATRATCCSAIRQRRRPSR